MEDWVAGGNSLKACPYYAAQYKLGEAEIIFCPYNYLIDPSREKFFFVGFLTFLKILDIQFTLILKIM